MDTARIFLFGFSDGATEAMELASTRQRPLETWDFGWEGRLFFGRYAHFRVLRGAKRDTTRFVLGGGAKKEEKIHCMCLVVCSPVVGQVSLFPLVEFLLRPCCFFFFFLFLKPSGLMCGGCEILLAHLPRAQNPRYEFGAIMAFAPLGNLLPFPRLERNFSTGKSHACGCHARCRQADKCYKCPWLFSLPRRS